MSIARRDFLKLAAAGGAGAGLVAHSSKAPAQTGNFPGKVIILGFDGASPVLTEKWMNAGLLPNLAKLRAMGAYAPIMTANPPQTPVSWASFATGMNPGKTRLFDFLRRNPETYIPELALVNEGMDDFLAGDSNPLALAAGAFAVGGIAGLVVKALYDVIRRKENPQVLKDMFNPQVLSAVAGIGVAAGAGAFAFTKEYLPTEMPTVENGVVGQTFWQYLDEKGIPTVSFRVPARFPADRLKNGRAVAGLGVPDVNKTMGMFTYYTTELLAAQDSGDTEMGGKIVPLYFKPTTNETKTAVFGPKNELFLSDDAAALKAKGDERWRDKVKQATVDLRLKIDGDNLRLETPDWADTLKVGQWSKPVTFSFKLNRFFSIEAYGKFHLLELYPDVKLYLQPLSFHPKTMVVARGPVRISTPQSLVGDLYDKYGPFKTLGWASDTWALNELRIPEEVFLEDMWEFVGQYREMMAEFIRSDDPLFVGVYSFTDRVAHMFWHHLDEKHPMYEADKAAKYSKIILEAYQAMDSIVGDVMKMFPDIGSKTRLFILSDHGFHSFRYAFNYNTWLAKNGFLQSEMAKPGEMMKLDDLFGRGLFWQNVDWSKSKAYALGLGGIYINLKGREKHGCVGPDEYEKVRDEIIAGLQGYVDPATGEKPIFKVYKREESYTGYDAGEMPDLRAGNNEGYRASWQSSLGGIPPEIVDVNKRKWSGDHCSYEPSITKGIFLSSHPTTRTDPNLLDFFPTILKVFGYEAPEEIDGKSLI